MDSFDKIFKSQKRVEHVTNKDELIEKISSGLTFYLGFDPSMDSLHVGHLVGIQTMLRLQECGCKPIVLIGGATGMIGDPSGRTSGRIIASEDETTQRASKLEIQLRSLLGNSVTFVNNAEWLSKMSVIDFIRDIASRCRVGEMLGRKCVKDRLSSDQGMGFSEFLYPTLQAYDFCYLSQHYGVSLQIGGSDQWGNITAGVDLGKKLLGTTLYGMTYPLLLQKDGFKFGKSSQSGDTIWLDPAKTSPYKFYQSMLQVPDETVMQWLRLLTDMTDSELDEIQCSNRDTCPNYAQSVLADRVTQFVHGVAGLTKAKEITKIMAPGEVKKWCDLRVDDKIVSELKEDLPIVSIAASEILGKAYVDVASKLSGRSKGEINRLIKGDGAYFNGMPVMEQKKILCENDFVEGKYLVFGFGKKDKILVEII